MRIVVRVGSMPIKREPCALQCVWPTRIILRVAFWLGCLVQSQF